MRRPPYAERAFGPGDDVTTLASSDRLAAALLAARQYRDATGQYEELLARFERALGPDHPDTLAALARLAGACSTAGQLSAALRHYQRAAVGYEHSLGAGHPLTLGCQGDLARACYDVGHAGDAVSLLRAAITAAGKALSPDDLVTTAAWPQLVGGDADWGGSTVPQAEAGPLPYPRGRTLGGSGIPRASPLARSALRARG